MKKLFILFVFLFFPCSVFAQLDVYLSLQNLSYDKQVWTSESYPDPDSSSLLIEKQFYREDFPLEYRKTPQEIKVLVDDVFSTLTPEQQQDRYNSLMNFDTQDFAQYLSIALTSEIETNISDKLSNGFMLTSFEETFQACSINLANRRSIAEDLIDDIHNGVYTDVESIQYSDIRFGDCIIPFPDARRGSTSIADSFASNKLMAAEKSGSYLNFWVLENSIDLLSLTNMNIEWLYEGVQESNLLELESTRVDADTTFEKEIWGSQVLYVHQNHYINPFKDSLISGNTTTGYTIWGVSFELHDLFITSSDSETVRTYSPWMEVMPWIYAKTLIQENTYELVSWVYVPKQNVWASTYYAILYNYDITEPECPSTLFSHENTGDESFLFPEYPWFHEVKYGYFVCSDDESGCRCDGSDTWCFMDGDTVLSIPRAISHNSTFSASVQNKAGLSYSCNSPVEQKLFYDTLSPDVRISLPGIPEASFIKEYVSNDEVLYDGIQVAEKRFYHLKNDISYQADENLDIEFEFYDSYDATRSGEGVSWLEYFNLSIFQKVGNDWEKKIEHIENFGEYNPAGNISAEDATTLNIRDLDSIRDIITKVGEYQIYIDILDGAWNEARVIFYIDITAGDIDPLTSYLDLAQRDIMPADNSSLYDYTLALRDEYLNPIVGQSISGIEHYCGGVPDCLFLRSDMTGASPSWDQALIVESFNSVSDSDGLVRFSLRSLAPGEFTESFRVSFTAPLWSSVFTGMSNSFLSPYRWALETRIWTDWVWDTLVVWGVQDYRVYLEDVYSLWYIWSLSNFSGNLTACHPETSFTVTAPLTTSIDGVYFSGMFSSSLSEGEDHKVFLDIIDAGESWVIISYTLWWSLIRYRLSPDVDRVWILSLWNTWDLASPVRIIWSLQWVGNENNSEERQNITDINSNVQRNIFRRNIGSYITTRVDNTIIWWVKYIDKTGEYDTTYMLESDPTFETLIVRNGNILIDDDFNTSGKTIWLISYIDGGYNKSDGYEKIGNIYVEPQVSSITAFIYADGWLISTESGVPVSGNISTRESILQNQLSIKGALFTRNTLAWWVLSAGEYTLPWWEKTTDQSLAAQYDLYYVRRGTNGCDADAYGFCNVPEYLIVEYDTALYTNPPKLFVTH